MVQVFGILTDPSGRPMQRQTVRVGRQPVGNPFDTAGGAVIQVGAYDTDTDGRWEANLIPSSQYEDAGQYYLADARDGMRIGDAQWTFRVPDTGGPFNIRDLLVTVPPAGTPIPPVAAHRLGDHVDVDTTGAADGNVLMFVLADGKWEPEVVSGGPGGGVASVAAGNGTIVIGGTATNPTVRVGTGIPESAIANLVVDLAAKYVKPGPGIPSSDLAAAVQSLLTAAGTAVQPGSLASVATSGAYADLSGKPVLAPVATSGVYADLTGKPTIPTTPGEVGAQPLDSDLTAIAALAPANAAILRRSGGTWIADDGVVALVDGATIATDAAAGLIFTVTLGGNRTLSNPTNSREGMKRTWRFRQDGTGTRTITLGTDFVLGSSVPNATLTGTAGKVGYLTAFYDSTAAKWHVLAFEPGV